MTRDELKLRLNKFAYSMIDQALPRTNLINNIGNATIKFYVDQNMYVVDKYLKPFEDQNGYIDTERYLHLLQDQLISQNDFTVDISKYIPEGLEGFVPSCITIPREAIMRVLQ